VSRYRDLKQKISRSTQRPQVPFMPENDTLGAALDDINAWGFIETWAQEELRQINCFGPGVYRGFLPTPWAGVVLWYKRRGYYHYGIIHLLGVWACQAADDETALDIVAGTKAIPYGIPLFNPEVYYRRLQTGFQTFYKDNGSPPSPASRLYSVRYDPARRLEIRQALEDTLADWAEAHNQAPTEEPD
jgi:hypothetical protein